VLNVGDEVNSYVSFKGQRLNRKCTAIEYEGSCLQDAYCRGGYLGNWIGSVQVEQLLQCASPGLSLKMCVIPGLSLKMSTWASENMENYMVLHGMFKKGHGPRRLARAYGLPESFYPAKKNG